MDKNHENFANLSPFFQVIYQQSAKIGEAGSLSTKRLIVLCDGIAESSFSLSDVTVVFDCGMTYDKVKHPTQYIYIRRLYN